MRMSSAGERKLISRLKALDRAIEEMRGKPVIVEGKKDKQALENCGIKERILLINRKPEDLCRSLSGEDEAIILTDFDERGEELAEVISELLRSYGVRPDTDCRRRLRYALGIRVFQEIDSRYEEIEKEKGIIR